MSKRITIGAFFLVTIGCLLPYFPPKVHFSKGQREQLKGCIKVPESITEEAPPFTVYFSGRMVHSDAEGYYSFPLEDDDFDEQGKLKELSLLLCSSLECEFDADHSEGSTIRGFRISSMDSYSYKKLSMEKEKKDGEVLYKHWKITDSPLPQDLISASNTKPFLVPETCVVIGLNPKYVEVENDWGFPLHEKFIQFPPIIVKECIQQKQNGKIIMVPVTKEKLQRCSDKAMCGDGMDLARFHTYTPVRTKKVDESIVRTQG